MNFIIDSKVFKNITERATVVLLKKGLFDSQKFLEIIAEEKTQMVTIKATNFDSFVEVYTDNVKVNESGRAFVEIDKLKYVYNMTGVITIETISNDYNTVDNSLNTLRVKNDKKQSEIIYRDTDSTIDFPSNSKENIFKAFSADKDDILDTFSKLNCCLMDEKTGKSIYNGFNLANVGVSRIASCDGFRALIREVKWNFNYKLNITIPGYVSKELTKVSANKHKEDISVYTDNKYAWFMGEDFSYITRLLEGQYLDVDRIIDFKNITYEFDISAKDISLICKEYSNILNTKKTEAPIYICYNDGKLVAVALSTYYKTSDVLEINNEHDIPSNMRFSVNPLYLKEITEVFENQQIKIQSETGNHHSSWRLVGDNGYIGLILPKKLPKDMSEIEKFISGI